MNTDTTTPPQSIRVLLSVEEAAQRLTISRTRTYALIKAGEIESLRIGRLRRVPANAIDDYVQRLVDDQHAA